MLIIICKKIILVRMEDESEILVELLREILGKEKHHYSNHCQISFNCPYCDEGRNKGNLECNYGKLVYKCWSCAEVNGTQGSLGKLIDQFGNKKQKKVFNLLRPKEEEKKVIKKPKVKLPEGYVKFKDSNPIYPIYRQANAYLKNRGVTDEMIEKFQIGFSDKGECSGRIIIPSYDSKLELNYYIARSWDPHSKSKYKNPKAEKDIIIFNEHLIDWNKDLYLVEGVFDAIFLDNAVPMLGKNLSELLFHTIYENAKGKIIVALDGDAWENAVKIYRELNGGSLYGRIKIVKLPTDKDICDLKGEINEYFYNLKD